MKVIDAAKHDFLIWLMDRVIRLRCSRSFYSFASVLIMALVRISATSSPAENSITLNPKLLNGENFYRLGMINIAESISPS